MASRSNKTEANYEDGIQHFLEANGWRDLREALRAVKSNPRVAEQAIINMISRLRDLKRTNMTIRLYLTAVRNLYSLYDVKANWMRIKQFIPKKRFTREVKPIPKRILVQVLPLLRPSKRFLVWFLFATGCRIGEAVALRVRDLDLNSDPPKAKIVSEKTHIPRIVFIPRDLAERLREWIKGKKLDHYVFHNERGPRYPLDPKHVRRAFQNALARLGYLKRDASNRGWEYHIHGLRRSFKTILQNAGMDGLKIEILMGHDVGIDRSYYRPSEAELAKEWKEYERYLMLETPETTINVKEREEIIKAATLQALEQTWLALNPNQPPEDLYTNAARFELGHYPNIDEKMRILRTAIQSYIKLVKEFDHAQMTKALQRAMAETEKEKKKRKRKRR